jgi:hypothetical protein
MYTVFAVLLRMVGAVAIGTLLPGIIAFLAAGRHTWTWPWVCVGINLVNLLVVHPLIMRIDSETAAGRGLPQRTGTPGRK